MSFKKLNYNGIKTSLKVEINKDDRYEIIILGSLDNYSDIKKIEKEISKLDKIYIQSKVGEFNLYTNSEKQDDLKLNSHKLLFCEATEPFKEINEAYLFINTRKIS